MDLAALGTGIATVRRVETSTPLVALTFDDGPDGSFTGAKLEVLASHSARATFFVLGKLVRALPRVVRAIVEAGSEVASHSYDHPNLAHLSPSGVTLQLQRTLEAMRAAGVDPPPLFRPPYGSYNCAVLGAAAGAGYRWNVLWDVDPKDWRRPGAAAVAGRVLSAVRPGSVVVLHDWVQDTAAALPHVLRQLDARGYRPVTVTDLLAAATGGAAP